MKKNKENLTISINKNTLFFFVFSVALGAIIAYSFPHLSGLYKTFQSNTANNIIPMSEDSQKQKSLEQTYNQLMEYEMAYDYANLYEYLTPSERTSLTKDEYIQNRQKATGAYNPKYTVHSITVHGDTGIVDRTVSLCKRENCIDSERVPSRAKKQYYYINGKWYHNLEDTVYCERIEKYTIPQEFDRALSLIVQRLKQSNDAVSNKNAERFNAIRNCLDIQYAPSDEDISGAEGVFSFSENSTNDRLQIFVSPRYEVKDDLLTAILLSHEIAHAFIFATGSSNTISCYENEALAFQTEMRFLGTLNDEEVASITYRYNNRSSDEVKGVINLITDMGRTSGSTPHDKALNWVKNNPFYQKQCGK